jgi:DNA-directed RNA polymerase subunit beta'
MPERATTLGKLLVDKALPPDMRGKDIVFNKKSTSVLFQELAERHPDEYSDVLQRMRDISRVSGTEYGGAASIRLEDMQLPPRTKAYRKELRAKVATIAQDPRISSESKQKQIVDMVRKVMPTVQSMLQKEMVGRENSYGLSISQGYKGSPTQLIQIMFGDMLVADHKGKAVPIPGLHGYGEGVTPAEYWAGSYASRKGFSDVQFATAKTGFLGKQLAAMAHRAKVTGTDCGAAGLGILVDGDDPEILGSVLSKDINGLKAGQVLTKKDLPKLRSKKPLVRSLVTCQQPEGICQKCSGKRDQGNFPAIGAHVGIDVGRVVSEPMTQQLGLSAKHTGGVIGLNSDNLEGFEEVNQFVQIPKMFRGAAVLAPKDGKVRNITKAPQGGHYIRVNEEDVFVPEGRKIEVSPGASVEAGDILTSGTPNPADIAMHKGLGEGRKYFQDKFYEILKKNGVPTHRRNVEVLSRSFFDRIRITNPDGVQGYTIGDIVRYGTFQKNYTPRKGAATLAPKRSVGSYLEKPVMHYTIGTRITPKIAKFLSQEGVGEVTSHKTHPGFEPQVTRAMGLPAQDPDWKVRLAGFGVKRSLLESARHGSESKHDQTSYVPSLMDPTRL